MPDSRDPVVLLSEDQAWTFLAGQKLGRLATCLGGEPAIHPVNFALQGRSIVFRTAPGHKLLALTANDLVAFEVDSWDDKGATSVICTGRAEALSKQTDVDKASQLPLRPWVATVKTHYVRVAVTGISGRQFRFGPDPVLNRF